MRKEILSCLLAAVYTLTISAQTKWMNPLEQGDDIIHGRWWNSELKDTYHRLTPRAEGKVRSAVWSLSRQSAGLSVCFHTNAPSIRVRYKVAGGLNMFHMPTTGVSGIDLYATDPTGKLRWCASKFNLSYRDTINYEFKDLTYFTGEAKGYDYELFLPLYNEVTWMEIGVPQDRELRFIPQSGERPVVVYGTSIAQGACASRTGMAWTNIVHREAGMPVINLGFSGNGQLEEDVFGYLAEIDARLFVIDCLPNMATERTELIYDRLLKGVKILRAKSTAPILLVEHNYANGISSQQSIQWYTRSNLEQRRAYRDMQAQGVSNLYYLTHDEMGFTQESMVEGIHPNDLGMHQYADAYIRKIHEIFPTPDATTDPQANPMIWSDYPDPDIIRVGEYYYMVTTTMHLMPGAPVMRSRDLVNWETVSYLFDSLHDTPAYDLIDGTKYGQGQWATSLRYHNGRFYALFVTNGVPGSWIYSTDDPTKGWKLHAHLKGFYHDASLFFDDDGRVYVFSGSGSVDITELTPDLKAEKQGGFRRHLEVHDAEDNGLLEGSRVVKKDGYYYLLMISWPHTGRRQLAYRSRSLTGEWEKKVILKSAFGGFPYVGQGTIVDGPDGEWHGVIFQDRGGVGRILTLSPVRWIDGWPMIGDEQGHVTRCKQVATVTKDRQWNHNPDSTAFSYDAREQRLELRTNQLAECLPMARNTLTWRMFGPECADTVRLDIRRMHDGDRTGFAAFNGDSGVLTVKKEGRRTYLTMTEESMEMNDRKQVTANNVTEQARVDITGKPRIWLSIHGDFRPGRDIANFSYSLDGREWHAIGSDFKMRFDYRRVFMGTRFALFNYATKAKGGKVVVEDFNVTVR